MTEVTSQAGAPEAPAKKKFNRADYIFQQKNGETLIKKPGQIDGKAFAIRFLENCTVYLYDHSAQVMVDKCNNCTFVVGPIKGSIFLRDCEGCTVHVACQQFRCRDLINSTVYLYTSNDPIIEASSGLRFAPFNIGYPKLKEQAELTGLTTDNKWELVFDFSKAGAEKNFSQIDPSEFSTQLLEIPDFEGTEQSELYFGYPQRYGGSLTDELPQSSAAEEPGAFSIDTSAREAQASVDQHQEAVVPEEKATVTQQQPESDNLMEAFMAPPVTIPAEFQAARQEMPMQVPTEMPVQAPVEVQMPMEMPVQAPVEMQIPTEMPMEVPVQAPVEVPVEVPVQMPMEMPMQMQVQAPMEMQMQVQSQPLEAGEDVWGSAVPEQVPVPAYANDGNDYSPEELAMMQEAEALRQKMQQDLYERQMGEASQKNARRVAATQAIATWKSERENQTQLRHQNNIQLEQSRLAEEAQDRNSMNQWERVCKNVNMTSSIGPGGKDLSRMKAAMVARRGDMANNASGAGFKF